MKKMQKGFSIVELMVIVVMIAIIGFVVVGKVNGGSTATEEAEKYLQTMGVQYDALQCQNWDSNNDGYISCTYSYQGKMGGIECASTFSFNSSCRVPMGGFFR